MTILLPQNMFKIAVPNTFLIIINGYKSIY